MLDGEYGGYKEIVSGVPVMIGSDGAEKIIEMALKPLQVKKFAASVASVQDMVDTLHEIGFFEDQK
jgi:malate dehydrogenase